jgi:hemoglobin/transferrin/lactoferrin receptor protein
MQRTVWIVLLLVYSSLAMAQVVSVKDQKSGQALEFVSIISNQGKTMITTDINGQANIKSLKDHPQIEFRLMGYQQKIISWEQLRNQQFAVVLEPRNISLEGVIVAASRFTQKTEDVPVKIATIRSKEVNLQNPQTAADLLSISGRVFIQKSQQGGGSPMIRGFATNRLLYAVDGVRMNTAIFRAGNIQNVISLDPFAIENTEVLFGPSSVMYGSDAIGGVMSFQTLTPQLAIDQASVQGGLANLRYSSANQEISAHFNAFAGFKKWSFLSSISSNSFGDLRMGANGPDDYLRKVYVQRINNQDVVIDNPNPLIQNPSEYKQQNFMQKIRYKVSDDLDIQYGFHYSETSPYSRYDRHLMTKNGLPRYGEWSYGPQKWMMNLITLKQSANHRLFDEVNVRLAQQFFEESRISRNFNSTKRETRTEQVDAWSANIDFRKQTGSRNRLTYGLEAIRNDVHSSGTDEDLSSAWVVPGPSRYPQANWNSFGIYLSDQLEVKPNFSLHGGMRYNLNTLDAIFDTTFYPFPFTTASLNHSALTGNLGLVFKKSQSVIFSANFSTAFRAPNVDDLGKVFDSEPGAVIVPNPDLKPEYAWNLDISYAQIFGSFMKFDITAYFTLLEDAMVRRDFVLNGLDSMMYDGEMSQVQAIQNAAYAQVYGIQAGAELHLLPGLTFLADANYQKGLEELEDGSLSPLRHAPPFFANARLNYQLNQLNFQLYALYNAEVSYENLPEEERGKAYLYAADENGNPYSPAWYTLNFKAVYPIDKHFSLSAGLENITDQRYRSYSSGISAPGRNFILSLKIIL